MRHRAEGRIVLSGILCAIFCATSSAIKYTRILRGSNTLNCYEGLPARTAERDREPVRRGAPPPATHLKTAAHYNVGLVPKPDAREEWPPPPRAKSGGAAERMQGGSGPPGGPACLARRPTGCGGRW